MKHCSAPEGERAPTRLILSSPMRGDISPYVPVHRSHLQGGDLHVACEVLTRRALLHGGPLDDSWWEVEGEPPKYLVPQEGLGTSEPVLLADFPVHVGGWRYELEERENGRVVYVWGRDERPEFEFNAVCDLGPAAGYSFHQFGLTEPWPFLRLAKRPALGRHDAGDFEWMLIPWPDGEAWPEEAWYELRGTLIPPGGDAEAHYSHRPEGSPYTPIKRAA